MISIGDETLEASGYGQYLVDGVSGADIPASFAGFPITKIEQGEHSFLFEIILAPNESIKVRTFKDMVSVLLNNATAARFEGSLGMMGDYTGKMLGRVGASIIDDPNEFAAEWQGDYRIVL